MNDNRNVKVGSIGVGWHGLRHVKGFNSLGNADLIAISDLDRDLLQNVAEEYEIPGSYTDYREMFEKENLDGVSIATPDHKHRDPAVKALQKNINVLLEKPMATNWKDAVEICQAAEESKADLMVNFANRWQIPNVNAYASVKDGELGDPLYAYARMVNTINVPQDKMKWAAKTALPHWLLTHAVDRVRWFFNCEPNKVRCLSVSGRLQREGIDAPDLYQATVEFKGGAIGNFEAIWNLPNSLPRMAGSYFEFAGSEGWTEIDLMKPIEKIVSEGKGYREPGYMIGEIYGEPSGTVFEADRHFVHQLKTGGGFQVTARDGLEVTKTILGMLQSSKNEGEIVDLSRWSL